MKTSSIPLGSLVSPAAVERCGKRDFPVLSMTMHEGLVLQSDRFKKSIASPDKSDYKVVKRGQLVVSFPIDEGVLSVQDVADAGIVSPAYAIWDIDATVVRRKWLEAFLRSPRSIQFYKSKLKGSTARRRSLPKETFIGMPVSLPSLAEQDEALDRLARVRRLQNQRQTQLSRLDELAKSLFVEMFGDPVENPKKWMMSQMSSVITHSNNGLSRRGKVASGHIVLRLVEVQDGFIDYSSPNRMKLSVAEMQKYRLFPGDFLFARVNGNPANVGRCAMFQDVGEPVFHNDHIIRVRLDQTKIIGPFASALLNSAFGKNQIRSKVKSSAGQYTVNQEDIGNISVILPSLDLQELFASRVEAIDKSKFAIRKSLDELNRLYRSLLQQYFG